MKTGIWASSFLVIGLVLGTPQAVARPAQDEEESKSCIDCHGKEKMKDLLERGSSRSFFVEGEDLARSVHIDLECADCHSGFETYPHAADPEPVDCGFCHDDAMAHYSESVHGLVLGEEGVDTATCTSCHGTHRILPSGDPESSTYLTRIEETCAVCHSKPEVMGQLGLHGDGPVKAYHESIHARVMRQNPEKGPPTCINCHGFHDIFRPTDPRSSFSPLNIPETCGACHPEAKEAYTKSLHWRAVRRGHYESPVCNDCHGEHGIESPSDRSAHTHHLNQSSRLCAHCHSLGPLMDRFGLDAERISSYMKTYHGLAVFEGSEEAATCTSCHETHAIRGSADPECSVHPDNLRDTCGRCHKKINGDFVKIAVHPLDQQSRNPIAFWTRKLYIILTVVLIGGMLLHNTLIFIFHIRQKYLKEKDCNPYQRFRRFEAYQHLLLILSFFTLVVTGFALKFPGSFWVEWLTSAGLTEGVRSTTHRIAGVALVAISVLQAVYLTGTRTGRKDMRGLVPRKKDFVDFWQNMKYHAGRTKNLPEFGRFDYTEKLEYLALIWGVIIMTATGFVLWFPEVSVRYLPWWVFETAEVVHFYEALLATLAVVIWHWFFVIYHPENYPVNLTLLNGQVCDLRFKANHPAEYTEVRGPIEGEETDSDDGGKESR